MLFFHSLSHVYFKTNNNDLGMIFFGCQMHCRVSFVIVKVDDVVVVELALAERRHELDLAHDGGSLKQCPAPRTELCIRVQPNPEKHFKMIQLIVTRLTSYISKNTVFSKFGHWRVILCHISHYFHTLCFKLKWWLGNQITIMLCWELPWADSYA